MFVFQGLNLLVCFNFCYILGSSERFDSHVSLPSFLSICDNAPLAICFDLRFRTMFRKITTSLSYNCISVFTILLQIFFLFNFLSVFCKFNICQIFNDLMFPNISLSFITNNVKGLQSYKKILKLIQYFKEKIGLTGVLFLQETHSSSKSEQK